MSPVYQYSVSSTHWNHIYPDTLVPQVFPCTKLLFKFRDCLQLGNRCWMQHLLLGLLYVSSAHKSCKTCPCLWTMSSRVWSNTTGHPGFLAPLLSQRVVCCAVVGYGSLVPCPVPRQHSQKHESLSIFFPKLASWSSVTHLFTFGAILTCTPLSSTPQRDHGWHGGYAWEQPRNSRFCLGLKSKCSPASLACSVTSWSFS